MGKWFHFCDLNYADWLDQRAVGISTRCLGIPNEEQCCRQSECDQRLVFPCFGDEIVYSGKNCLEKCKFGIESQEEEHEEEEEGGVDDEEEGENEDEEMEDDTQQAHGE